MDIRVEGQTLAHQGARTTASAFLGDCTVRIYQNDVVTTQKSKKQPNTHPPEGDPGQDEFAGLQRDGWHQT